MSDRKPSNPKDRFGIRKANLSYVSLPVILEVALGMQEGGYKYGRHNYRVIGVRASVYFDATIRHLFAWWEGEDFDTESKASLHHVSKAIASLTVLRDAMMQGNLTDDRPPAAKPGWVDGMNKTVEQLAEAFPDPVEPYTQAAIVAGDKVELAVLNLKEGDAVYHKTHGIGTVKVAGVYTEPPCVFVYFASATFGQWVPVADLELALPELPKIEAGSRVWCPKQMEFGHVESIAPDGWAKVQWDDGVLSFTGVYHLEPAQEPA